MTIETHSQIASFIWSICNLLRGPYKRNEYRKVILPLTVLRRFDCILAPTKADVLKEHAAIKAKPENIIRHKLCSITGHAFYNLSKLDLPRLLDDPNQLAPNLNSYINGFSPNVRAIMERFGFDAQIAKMAEKDLLYLVVKAFCDPKIDLSFPNLKPDEANVQMGYLIERWQAHGLSAVRLHPEVQAKGFTGSLKIVRRFLQSLRAEGRIDARLTVRFETPPGEQAQCDWAEVGRYPQPDGTTIKVYAFVMILCYSRYLYVEFTRSMALSTLIRCHQNAFAFFGGWTKRILYDNMRQVVVGANRTNARFLDFSRHYGFEPKRHRPYRPRTKGKVERTVGYVRTSFLNGRTFTGLDDLNSQGRHWLGSVANVRVHGTTQARPCDRLLEETLIPVTGLNPYQICRTDDNDRTVGTEALVRFDNSVYSVPARYVGTRVSVDAGASCIIIHSKHLIVAEHPRATAAGQRVEAPAHVKERWERSLRPPLAAPPQGCHVTFSDAVQVRSLELYAEATR